MNTEFNWWLLIVGLVIGAGLVWLVLADSRRREVDVTERERESEARWIAEAMRRVGRRIEDADALDVLRLHEAYLEASPPDELEEDDALEGAGRPDPFAERRDVATAASADRRSLPPETRAPMAHRVGAGEPLERNRTEREAGRPG